MSKFDKVTYESLVRIEQKSASDSNRNINNLNETERSLCGQLMLVSTVFLTVSVVVLGNSDALSRLVPPGRWLIIGTFVMIVSSIACGIMYYFENLAFYEKWSRIHHEEYETFRDGILEVSEINVKDLNDKSSLMPEATDKKWLKRQITLLAAGATFCVVLLLVFVLSTNTNSNNVQPKPLRQHYRIMKGV